MNDATRILVREKIAEAGIDALREHFDVDLGVDWEDGQLEQRIGDYDGLVIRSSTQVTADLLERARRLRVIGRAGIGVDNVDVEAATRQGVVVANAPESNIIAAAEHTIALMLALARNVPQAHASLAAGAWERSKFGGVEVYEKTLGIVGFGRIGQLVAARARGLEMRVVAFDPYVSAERFRELGVEKADSPDDLYARADFVTIHLPRTPDTHGFVDADAFAAMRDGVRVINCARGELLVDEALVEAIGSGKVAGAALDVFGVEPITDHPLFGHPNVVVTPHLGASTTEAQDRAGVQTAEQVIAALTGGVVTNAVNIPTIGAEDMEVLEPFLALCEQLGRLAIGLAQASSVDRIEIAFQGRIAEFDTRLLGIAALRGVLAGHTEEAVNYVNARTLADQRGIQVTESKDAHAEDFTELVRVAIVSDGQRVEIAGTGIGPRQVPHLVEAWGQRFKVELERHLTLFRYSDVPGMIGRVGTIFGTHGVNIDSAAVGREPDGDEERGRLAVMVVTTDKPVPHEVIDEIVASEGFVDGRTVAL